MSSRQQVLGEIIQDQNQQLSYQSKHEQKKENIAETLGQVYPRENLQIYQKEQQPYRSRNKMSDVQLQFLLQEYQKNPNWSRQKISQIAQNTQLSKTQIYKWNWDQKQFIDNIFEKDCYSLMKCHGKLFNVVNDYSRRDKAVEVGIPKK
ncbi:UNKNOWN [Stylonychia lemnae]|uniref:Homeobox domain-containing protein n=1 Tax=Stylonychia lemnae TaxID=5949 RepID=A0A078AJF6_STYLE|nr:UNKNOWN [Stylonychia lemnae]|eukprot:CDW81617.1 UNKNOWN [Stylonychia lemnae]